MDQRVTTWRWIVSIFKFRNEIYKQLERKKDGKNEVSFLVSMFPSWVMVIKLSKKVNFCNFVMTLARSLSLLKQFTYMHLKGVITHSQKMVLFIMLTYCFGDITVWSQIFVTFLLSIFFDALIANVSLAVAQTPINHIIFWKSLMRTFRCIYVNCFNRLRFIAAVSTKLQKKKKSIFLDYLRSITEEGNMESRQMTPFYSSTFPL